MVCRLDVASGLGRRLATRRKQIRARAADSRKPFDLKWSADIIPPTDQPMARLVVLSEGFTGLAHELQAEKLSIGRIEDNSFQISEASVSSHHCEIIKRGEEFLVRDLNSTNGTFIDGEQITEAVLKPGHILRLGQVEVRLETAATGAAAAKKPLEKTMVLPQGVRPQELDPAQRQAVEVSSGFSRKTNKTNRIFIGIGIVLGVLIIVILVAVFLQMA
jgi:hypothetical protein